MWRMLLKLVAMRFVSSRLQRVGLQLMSLTERRAHMFTQSIRDEWNRLVKTLICLVLGFACFAFSVLIGIVWLVATAWESPDRNLILGISLTLPLLLLAGISLYVRKMWVQRMFMHGSRAQLNEDWTVMRSAMKERPEVNTGY